MGSEGPGPLEAMNELKAFDLKRPPMRGAAGSGRYKVRPWGATATWSLQPWGSEAKSGPQRHLLRGPWPDTLPTLALGGRARQVGRPTAPLRGSILSSLGPSPKLRPLIPSETRRVALWWPHGGSSGDSIRLAEWRAQPLTSPSGASACPAL